MTGRRLRRKPSLSGECGEFHPAKIPKYGVRLLDRKIRRGQRLHMAARDEDVLPSVVVEVSNIRRISRHGKAELGHPTFASDFGEAAFAVVLVDRKGLAIERDDNNIGISIVVDVPKIDAHPRDVNSVLTQSDIGFKADFFKLSVSQVAKEGVH